jgi:hypothetical protein
MYADRPPEGTHSSLESLQVFTNHLEHMVICYLWEFIPLQHVSESFSFFIIYANTG